MRHIVSLFHAFALLFVCAGLAGWWRSGRDVDQWTVRLSPRVSNERRDRTEWTLTSAGGELEVERWTSWEVDRPPVPFTWGHRPPGLYDSRPSSGLAWLSFAPSSSRYYLWIDHADDRIFGRQTPRTFLHRIGFGCKVSNSFSDAHSGWNTAWWAVPYWFPVVVLSAATAWRARTMWTRANARGRAADGRCVECGYDLRMTPDRCPECGTPAAPGTKTGRKDGSR